MATGFVGGFHVQDSFEGVQGVGCQELVFTTAVDKPTHLAVHLSEMKDSFQVQHGQDGVDEFGWHAACVAQVGDGEILEGRVDRVDDGEMVAFGVVDDGLVEVGAVV